MKTKFLLLLTVLLCGATSVWADDPSWLRSGDSWDDLYKQLTINSNLDGLDGFDVDYYSICSGSDEIVNLVVADAVSVIGDCAFSGCTNLQSVSFGTGLTTIGEYAFAGTALRNVISIPANVTSIGDCAFSNCSDLTDLYVPPSNANYMHIDYVLFSKDGTKLVAYPAGKTATSYDIPATVTTISPEAFYGCFSLASVTFPAGLTTIGYDAFDGCGALTAITVASENTTYKSEDGVLFLKDGTKLIIYPTAKAGPYTIPSTVTAIDDDTFSDCTNLTSITIPTSVTSIGASAFWYCTNLTSIDIPSSVTTIGNYAFKGSGLTSVTIPATVTSLGENAFADCSSLASVRFADGITLTEIPQATFSGCSSLTSVNIPTSMTKIGTAAFQMCSSLTSFTIPASVTQIGNSVFYGSTGMMHVYCYANPAGLTWGTANYDFKGSNKTICHVKGGTDWSSFASNVRVTFQDDLVGTAPLKANEGDTPGEYWATYYNSGMGAQKVGGSAEVYTAKLGASSVELTQVFDGVINSAAAVILKSTSPTVPLITSGSSSSDPSYSDNELNGFGFDTPVTSGTTYYTLSRGSDGTGPVGFYQFSGSTLAAQKAFFAVTSSSPVRAYYGFGEDGGETGIADMPAETELSGEAWYDLSGRRLEGKPAEKGIYVKNGRKYLVK